MLILRIWRTDCLKVHVHLISKSCFTYSENWKIVFVSVVVKKWSSTAICKNFDFEYVTYACTQFVKAWLLQISFKTAFFKTCGTYAKIIVIRQWAIPFDIAQPPFSENFVPLLVKWNFLALWAIGTAKCWKTWHVW